MVKIAALVDQMFEDSEYAVPARTFREAGYDVIEVGLYRNKLLAGERQYIHLMVDLGVKDTSVNDFDALFIPGGYSPDHLRIDPDAVSFVREFVQSGKPVFSICHAPQILITADVLKGRKIAGWKSLVKDIENAGATYVDKPVVEDGNIISSRNPGDIPEFISACINRIKVLEEQPAGVK